MQVHMAAGDVRSDHFAVWLEEFDQVLHDDLPSTLAQSWSKLAHRIGQGLQFGLDNYRTTDDGAQVPRL